MVISPVTYKIPFWSDSCTHPYTSMNSEASLGLCWCWCCGLACTCRNSPPVWPLEEAERLKKQMLPELLVMPRLSNAKRCHVRQPCVRLQENWAVQMLYLTPRAYTWKAFIHPKQKRLLCMHFQNHFNSKLKPGCCQKRWACPTTAVPCLLLTPAFPQLGNGVLGDQNISAWKLTLLKKIKSNQTSFQEDERARQLLWHKRAEMHDLG